MKMMTMKMEISTEIYSSNDINKLLLDIPFIKSNKKIEYANVPCVIDIETSSFYDNKEKRAIQYAFVFGINGKCIIGRYMSELKLLIQKCVDTLKLSETKRMIFYVHNLAYEFQWFRKHFKWNKVFSIEERKPIYALTTDGVELRCSYLLSGYSLSKVGEHLTKYKVNKMVGDLDYSLLRTPKTPLNDKELGYILNDGLVVMAYIGEMIESHHNNITLLPFTKTGEVRNYCRKNCLYKGGKKYNALQFKKYRRIMKNIQIQDVKEYYQLQRAFQGGFTHANMLYVNTIQNGVASFDFTSSYPAVMCSEEFPMSSGKLVKITSKQEFFDKLSKYCCLFDIELFDVEASNSYDHPISESKCYEIEEPKIDNGRVFKCKRLKTTITEQDFFVIQDFYKFSHFKISNFRIYRKGYLPRDFMLSILELYKKKTELKGVKGMELEYQHAKENINSCYGMCVTDICRDEAEYENDMWTTDFKNDDQIEMALAKYNKNIRRFLCYQWGIWVTAYARRNLFSGIKEFAEDYIYSDTDSLKVKNYEKHMDYIERYNKGIKQKIKNALMWNYIDVSYAHPKTIKGDEKWLGVWEFENENHLYKEFKTLGAKRYMVHLDHDEHYVVYKGDKKYEYDIPYSLTISGLNKTYAIPYLYGKYKDNIMNAFDDGMYVPKGETGKNIHTYIDYETSGVVCDYLGTQYEYNELSSIHMEECDYDLSMSREFTDLLFEIKEFML